MCVLPVVLHTSKENTFSKTTVFFLWFWFDRRRHGCLIARAHNEGVARFVSVIEYYCPLLRLAGTTVYSVTVVYR